MDSPFSRVAKRLRNISQVSYQVAQAELSDSEVIKNHPQGLRQMASQFKEAGEILEQYASEEEAYLGRRQEDTDALISLAQTAANVATIIGTDGQNIEIITHSDPDYILGVLTRGAEEALETAFNKLPPEKKKKFKRWLK